MASDVVSIRPLKSVWGYSTTAFMKLLGKWTTNYEPSTLNRPSRQLIHPLVFTLTGVAAHPMPLNLVRLDGFIQDAPQILVFDGFLPGGLPAARFPVSQPFGDPAAQIFGVSVEGHLARLIESFKGLDRGGEFHAVVSRISFSTGEYLLVAAKAE